MAEQSEPQAADQSETQPVEGEPTPEAQSTPATRSWAHRVRALNDVRHPFRLGFTVTLGAVVALGLASAVGSLSTVMISVGVALFLALALDPVVRWLERKKVSRGLSIAIVFIGFAAIVAALVAWLLPTAITQIVELAGNTPEYVRQVQDSDWFKQILDTTGQGSDMYQELLHQLSQWLSDPSNLLTLGGGAIAVGSGAVDFLSGALIVIVLTLYFLASLDSMKQAMYRLAPAYSRPRLAELTEQVTRAVGGYVGGMVILASCNAAFAFILLTALGIPFAPLLALLALMITMIPMIGPFLFLVLATIICLLHAPLSGLIFAVVYFAYMEVEAYLLTPKVMNRAVNVPGALVLIGAMVGASLLGLLGALVAVPVTASLLIVLRSVYIPRQDARTVPID